MDKLFRGECPLGLDLPRYRMSLTRFAVNSPPLSVRLTRFFQSVYVFLGLYIVSLFSVWMLSYSGPSLAESSRVLLC